MSKTEFAAFMLMLTTLRDALRVVNEAKRRHPAGIEMLLSKRQYEEMKRVEDEIEQEISTL